MFSPEAAVSRDLRFEGLGLGVCGSRLGFRVCFSIPLGTIVSGLGVWG